MFEYIVDDATCSPGVSSANTQKHKRSNTWPPSDVTVLPKPWTKQFTFFLLMVTLCHVALADRPKFSDQQIVAMTPHYFKRSKEAPEFLGANVYLHPQRGKVFQIDIRVNRNEENEALGFVFSAMLTLGQYFKKGPKLFVVVLHSNSRGIPPAICTGDAQCTADHFLRHRITYEEWYYQCISFERP